MDDSPVPVDLADDPPRYYRIPLPSGGAACVRIAGEVDPVMLTIPGAPRVLLQGTWSMRGPANEFSALEVQIPRNVAWALWAVLSDALLGEPDAVPDWAIPTVEPTDEHGQPLPVPIP